MSIGFADQLKHRVRFDRRVPEDDGSGNVEGDFAPLFTIWAAFKAAPGEERVAAGRLESTFNGTLTVRACMATEGVVASDRCVFTAGRYVPRIGNIRSIVPSEDGESIAMTIEIGVAT